MTIELPNGSTLITSDTERLVLIMKGMEISAEILPANNEVKGSDAWANEEIRLYEEALKIDLQAQKDFLVKCLLNSV